MNTLTTKNIFSVYIDSVLLESASKFNRQQFVDRLHKKSEVFRDALLDLATRIDMNEKDQADAIDELFDAAQKNIFDFIESYKDEITTSKNSGEYTNQALVDDINSAFSSYLGKVAFLSGPDQWKMTFPSSSNFYPQNRPQQPTQQSTAQQSQPTPPAQAFNPQAQNSTQQPTQQSTAQQSQPTPPAQAQNSTQQPFTPTKNVPGAVPLNPSLPVSQQQVNPFTGLPIVPIGSNKQPGGGWNPFANAFKAGPGSTAKYVPKSGPLAGTQQPVYPTRQQAYDQKEAGQSPLANTGNVLADFNRRRAYLSGRGY
jgi:hypothetical protein